VCETWSRLGSGGGHEQNCHCGSRVVCAIASLARKISRPKISHAAPLSGASGRGLSSGACRAVNTDLMLQAMIGSAKGKPNQIVYWSRLPDWKNQTLTAESRRDLPDAVLQHEGRQSNGVGNPTADDGVINGTIMMSGKVPLEDVGRPASTREKRQISRLAPNHSAPPFRMATSRCLHTMRAHALLTLDSQERQRCRHRQGRRLCQADSGCIRSRRRPTRR